MIVQGMSIGVALDFAPVAGESYADRLAALAPVIDAVERYGFASISAGESYPHRADDPMGFHAPNALMMLAAIAQRTTVANLIAGVVLLGAWPVPRLARDVALVNHLCGGRLILGVGLGPLPLWETRTVTAVDIGTQFETDLVELRDTLVATQPVHPDGPPPIWVGGALPRSTRRAAELADGYVASTGYRHTLVAERAHNYRTRRPAGRVAANRLCVIGRTRAQVDERLDRGPRALLAAYRDVGVLEPRDLDSNGTAVGLIGTPDEVADRLGALAAAGVTDVQLRVAAGTTTPADAIDTMRLFAETIAPPMTDDALHEGKPG